MDTILEKIDAVLEAKSDIQVGDKVKILRGNFKGKMGKVVDYSVESDEVVVKVGSQERYLGFDDVELK